MTTEIPSVSPYDNQISLLYKAGSFFETPVRYITVRDRQPKDVISDNALILNEVVYQDLLSLLSETLDTSQLSLQEVSRLLLDPESTVSQQELAFLYYTYAKDKNVPPEEVLDRVNIFMGPNKGFRNLTDLTVRYDAWLNQWQKDLDSDEETLNRILDNQEILENVPEDLVKEASDLVIDRVTLRCYPVFKGTRREPTYEDGIDIFNEIYLSYLAPYAYYNEGSSKDNKIVETYYKIYRGEITTTDINAPGSKPNLSMIMPMEETGTINKGNLIYVTVWTGPKEQVINRPTRGGYTEVIYDLDTGMMTFKTKISAKNPQAKELLIERVATTFPSLDLGETTETSISGDFNLYLGEPIEDYILLHEILNNPTFVSYLYVDERQDAYPEKKRNTIHYRSIVGQAVEETDSTETPASISTILNQKYVSGEEDEEKFPKGTPYLHVNITRGASREDAEQFKTIFRLLMGIYLQDKDEIITSYQEFIPPFVLPLEVSSPRKSKKSQSNPPKKKGNIYELKRRAPDIFVSNYARKCQSQLQPSIIEEDEVEFWQNKEIYDKNEGRMVKRQVMPFPPSPYPSQEKINEVVTRYRKLLGKDIVDKINKGKFDRKDLESIRKRLPDLDPESRRVILRIGNPNYIPEKLKPGQLLLVCPNDAYPYPGVKTNVLPNKEEYPYIPCCNATDQTPIGSRSDYNVYYRSKETTKDNKKRQKIITGKKVSPGGLGEIPVPLEKILTRYSPESVKFKRLGVIRDENSFLHCVLEALNYKSYSELNEEERINLVFDVRKSIADNVNMAVMKQELYEFSLDTIYQQMVTEDLFFDPSLYYRSVEEYFGVNIYTLTPGKRPKEPGEAIGKIEVPRHKLFHARPIRRERPTILIFKHWGAEADALTYPQCELLIDYDTNEQSKVALFGERMTDLVHSVLMGTHPVSSWSFQKSGPQTEDNLNVEVNVYSRVNFDNITANKARYQIIDDYGKLRGLVIDNENETTLTYFFIPSQPENIPLAENILLGSIEESNRYFGQPIAQTRNNDGQVNGVWYSDPDFDHDQYIIFVPLQPNDNNDLALLPEGPPPPIDLNINVDENTVDRVLRLERQISLLLQIIRWVFLIYKTSHQDTYPDVDDFMKKYVGVNTERVEDSSTFYDLSGIQRRLPIVNSVEEAVNYLENVAPSLVRDNKIFLYSTTFAEKISGYLRNFIRQSYGIALRVPRYLDNYYRYESDFLRQPQTVVLIGRDSLNAWLTSLQHVGYQGITIKTQLDVTLSEKIEPYLYLDEEGTTYLIQNVDGGDFDKAMEVNLQWIRDFINPGFIAPPNDYDLPYRIYEISPSGGVRFVNEESNPNYPDLFFNILMYSQTSYAALLVLSQSESVLR